MDDKLKQFVSHQMDQWDDQTRIKNPNYCQHLQLTMETDDKEGTKNEKRQPSNDSLYKENYKTRKRRESTYLQE
jgi:hypothetical protein